MDREEAIRRVKHYAGYVRQEFPGSQIILFGSCARNEANEESDIDVAVLYPVSDRHQLFKANARLFGIAAECGEPLIEPIMLRDLNDEWLFHREIQRDGIYIN